MLSKSNKIYGKVKNSYSRSVFRIELFLEKLLMSPIEKFNKKYNVKTYFIEFQKNYLISNKEALNVIALIIISKRAATRERGEFCARSSRRLGIKKNMRKYFWTRSPAAERNLTEHNDLLRWTIFNERVKASTTKIILTIK